MQQLECRVLTEQMMERWKVDTFRWKVQFSLRYSTPARCLWTSDTGGRLVLNESLVQLESEDNVLESVKHEIAHIKAGRENKHNKIWKAWAVQIGCTPRACSTRSLNMAAKYEAVCPHCQFKYYWQKQPKYQSYLCKFCPPDLGELVFTRGKNE